MNETGHPMHTNYTYLCGRPKKSVKFKFRWVPLMVMEVISFIVYSAVHVLHSDYNKVFVFKNSNLFPFHIAAHVSSTITSQKLWKGPLFITKLSLILGRWRIVTKLLNKYPFLKLQNIEPLLTHILAKKNKPSINHIND